MIVDVIGQVSRNVIGRFSVKLGCEDGEQLLVCFDLFRSSVYTSIVGKTFIRISR